MKTRRRSPTARSKKTNYVGLSRLLRECEGRLVDLPPGVTPFALAKCCWEHWCAKRGVDAWQEREYRLYNAIPDMLRWIEGTFVGGVSFASGRGADEQSPAHRIWVELEVVKDKEGLSKFSKAARMLMDFVVYGETKMHRRESSLDTPEQLELPRQKGEPNEPNV